MLAAGLSSYMLYASLQLQAQGYRIGILLCSDTTLISCRQALLSRYARWLGMPVAGLGAIHYLALLTATVGLLKVKGEVSRQLFWNVGLTLAMLGTGAGLWFLWVQVFRLHVLCYLCDIVHACGLVSMILLLGARPAGRAQAAGYLGTCGVALAGLAALVLGQLLVQPQIKPEMLVVATQPAATLVVRPPADTQPIHAFIVRDSKGTEIAVLDLDKEIVLGNPTAERTIIELMDFGCPECKHELVLFQEIWKVHPRWFRVICLMFPNNKECNPHAGGKRPHVCEITRAALAVRKYAPDKYTAVHDTFYRMQDSLTGGLAWETARQLCRVDDSILDLWQDDATVLERIRQQADLGAKLRASTAKPGVPLLYANGMVYCGSDENVKDLEQKLIALIGSPDYPVRFAGAPTTAAATHEARLALTSQPSQNASPPPRPPGQLAR